MERAAPQELSQKRSRRQIIIRYTLEVFQELKQPDVLGEMTRQDKMFEIFKEHHRWQSILGIRTVGDFNQLIPDAEQRTAEISEAHNSGMHTTTFSEMLELPELLLAIVSIL